MSYKKNAEGDEYYGTQYAKKRTGHEYYAQKKNGSQFYFTQSDGYEIMATKLIEGQRVPFFAVDNTGHPICPFTKDVKNENILRFNIDYYTDPSQNELYPRRNTRDYFILALNHIKYAKNATGDQYYPLMDGKAYYASKQSGGEVIEFPAKDKTGKNRYIEDNGIIIYPRNITSDIPLYNINLTTGDEVYLKKNKKEFYGCNSRRLPFYAKNKNFDHFFATDNEKPYYASYTNDNNITFEYYPKLMNTKQFYLHIDLSEIYAKHDSNDILATDEQNVTFYAKNDVGEYYPSLKDGKNFYKKIDNIETLAVIGTDGYYAKDNLDNEFYPKNFNNVVEEDAKIDSVFNIYTTPTDDEIIKHLA